MSITEYAQTDREREVCEAVEQHGGIRPAARALGIKHSGVHKIFTRVKTRAALKGYAPAHDMTHTVPDGFRVKGVSTFYDDEGQPVRQWVKSEADRERQQEMLREALESMTEYLPRVKPSKAPKLVDVELMAIYPLGDPHIGVLSWAEETGEDWDLKIAEEKFCGVFDRLVKTAPRCDQAVIVNLGDYFHSDNMAGVTTRSGHTLDMDGRYAKMIRVGVKIIRQMIASALAHHKTVRVINAVGNHDDTGALFLSVALANIYESEPRVTIDDRPAPFHYFRHGKSLYGVHHGHSCKPDRLPGVMAADQAKLWGETEYRTWLTGHIHHDTKKEHAGCVVESFRTLAAKDAYATWGGYRAGQDSKCLVVHKDYGEIERHTVNLAMAGEAV